MQGRWLGVYSLVAGKAKWKSGPDQARDISMGKQILRDLFHGRRVVRKRPVPPLLAILALTLGIGISTAVFSIVARAA